MGKKRWLKGIVTIIYTLAVTYMAWKWACFYAYLERGYEAFGGEYLVIPVAAWASYKAIHKFFNGMEEEKECNNET